MYFRYYTSRRRSIICSGGNSRRKSDEGGIYGGGKRGKAYIPAAIANPLNIGSGHGPVNHWAYRD